MIICTIIAAASKLGGKYNYGILIVSLKHIALTKIVVFQVYHLRKVVSKWINHFMKRGLYTIYIYYINYDLTWCIYYCVLVQHACSSADYILYLQILQYFLRLLQVQVLHVCAAILSSSCYLQKLRLALKNPQTPF